MYISEWFFWFNWRYRDSGKKYRF